jgi:hypothetical protein
MRRFFANTLWKVGFWMLILGTGPLLLIIAAAELGLLSDPNPNPIGPGLLMFFTFWPAVICLGIGTIQVMSGAQPAPREGPSDFTRLRTVAGVVGALLILRGTLGLVMLGGTDRGTASMLVIGVVAVWWSRTGKMPGWWGSRR